MLASWHLSVGLGEECISKPILIVGRICFLAGGRHVRSHSLLLEAASPSSFKPATVHLVLLSSSPDTSLESWTLSYRWWGSGTLPMYCRPFQYAQWTFNYQYLYLCTWRLFWNFERLLCLSMKVKKYCGFNTHQSLVGQIVFKYPRSFQWHRVVYKCPTQILHLVC